MVLMYNLEIFNYKFGGKRRRSEASRSFPIIFRRRSRRNRFYININY